MNTARPLTHYAMLSLGVAVLTFFLKLAAWRLTGSVGLLSDALESLANIAAALIALGSLRVAARPPDDDHAYGHSKVEYFAGGCEGAFILVAAAGIGWNAIDRFLHPREIEAVGVGIAVSVVASLILFATARVLARVAKERDSVALAADARHLMTDVWTSVAVVIALILVSSTGWLWLDPAVGLLLAVYIVITGVRLMHSAMLGLIDTALPPTELTIVKRILDEAAARGVHWHALRTRQAGVRRFLSVHLLMPGAWTIDHGHDVAEQIELALCAALPRLTAVTHLEPLENPSSWNDTELDRFPEAS